MSPEDVSDASDVPSETTARILRRLADIDAACFPRVGSRRRRARRLRETQARGKDRRLVRRPPEFESETRRARRNRNRRPDASGGVRRVLARVGGVFRREGRVGSEPSPRRPRDRGASYRRGGGARETRVPRLAPRGIDERVRTRRRLALSETRVRRRRRQPDDEGFLRTGETRREHDPRTLNERVTNFERRTSDELRTTNARRRVARERERRAAASRE